MTFLTQSDFDVVIRQSQLDKILTANPTVLDNAVEVALDEIVSFLTGRYDLTDALAATSTARNSILVMRAVDMTLYHLFSRISPNNIPDIRRDRYTEAIEFLKGAQKGTRFLSLPVIEIEDQKGYFLFGSNKQYRNFI